MKVRDLRRMRAGAIAGRVAASLAVGIACAGVGLPDAATSQEGRREVEAGNRLYRDGRYSEAHARYLEALEKVPGLPLARFNEGNVLYQSQEFERAAEAYMKALEDGEASQEGNASDLDWSGRAWYNLGNALLRRQQLGPAAEAYKEALRRDPFDADAKHNLEVALAQLEQQQQQQQGEGQDGEDGQDSPQAGQSNPNEGDGEEQDRRPGDDPQQSEDESQQGGGPQPNPDGERNAPGASPQESDDRQGQPQQMTGEMTPEQAERLLQAVGEDPSEVNRKAAQVRGRRPRKDW